MARSLKKGPFADEHLLKKVDKLNESNKAITAMPPALRSNSRLASSSTKMLAQPLRKLRSGERAC